MTALANLFFGNVWKFAALGAAIAYIGNLVWQYDMSRVRAGMNKERANVIKANERSTNAARRAARKSGRPARNGVCPDGYHCN